jgi:hypothetical protein
MESSSITGRKNAEANMINKKYLLILTIILVNSVLCFGQMLNPAIDKSNEPFCYYSKPTDVIGVMDGKEATLVSPEGYFYTGSSELMFFTGYPAEPVNQRVKTLTDGYLPVIQYRFVKEGIEYNVEAFAATLDGNPESALMNFIRVKIKNANAEKRTAYFASAVRYQNEANVSWDVGDNRFGRPVKAEKLGGFEQLGDAFNRDWEYSFEEDALIRDDKLLYIFPKDGIFQKMMTLKTGYNEAHDISPQKIYALANTPTGIVQYKMSLNPSEEKILEFKFPYLATQKDDSILNELRKANYDDYLIRTKIFWNDILTKGLDISVPEKKVNDTFKANLIYDLIARNKYGNSYIQMVNEFQYDSFWLRDASTILRMYDISGYHSFAKQCLDFFPRWQQPDGNFVSQGGQYDGWGQTIWAYGQHYLLTRDKKFAEAVFPSVKKAVEWLKQARKNDPLNIIPVTTPGDNENITGHVTGHNFIAIGGLKNAIVLADALGKKDDAKEFKKEFDDYFAAFMKQVKRVAAKTNNYITPGLDELGGQDWGNMLSVYPEFILDPFDPLVTATLETSRKKYQEGIMTYGDGRYLHHYLTMNNTQTELIRGEQKMALDEFYSILMHTSATHAGFEFAIVPWSTRDFGMNLSPHGWFAAEFRILMRNMMVREEKNELHLLSLLSPEWIKEGEKISVYKAPTNFGTVNFDLQFSNGTALLKLSNKFHEKPEKLVLHLPWFMSVSELNADGKKLPVKNNSVILPVDCKQVSIKWQKKSEENFSYQKTVDDYKDEYSRRYYEFLRNGSDFK